VDEALALLDRGSVDLIDRPVFGIRDVALTDAVEAIQIVIGRLTAVQGALVREIDGRGLVRASGAVNATAWLADRTHMSLTEARKVTAVAAVLDTRADLSAALAAGAVTTAQVLAIGEILDALPAECEPGVADKAAAMLVDYARTFAPSLLRKLGDRVLGHIAPEVADAQLRRRLDRDER
jgi:DICT domain-containing protein